MAKEGTSIMGDVAFVGSKGYTAAWNAAAASTMVTTGAVTAKSLTFGLLSGTTWITAGFIYTA